MISLLPCILLLSFSDQKERRSAYGTRGLNSSADHQLDCGNINDCIYSLNDIRAQYNLPPVD